MNAVTTDAGQAIGFVHTATGISLDVIVLIVIFVALAAYGFYFGKRRLAGFILAFYPATLLYTNFPYLDNLVFWKNTVGQVELSKALIFAIMLILCNLAANPFLYGDFSYGKSSRLFEVAILSISALILIVVAIQYIVPLGSIYAFSGAIGGLFSSKTELFWWLLAPLAGLWFGGR